MHNSHNLNWLFAAIIKACNYIFHQANIPLQNVVHNFAGYYVKLHLLLKTSEKM